MAGKKKATGSMVSFAKKRKAQKSHLDVEEAIKTLQLHVKKHRGHLKAMRVFGVK